MVLRQAGRHALGPNPTKLELPYRSRCQDSESPQPHLEDGSVYRARWWARAYRTADFSLECPHMIGLALYSGQFRSSQKPRISRGSVSGEQITLTSAYWPSRGFAARETSLPRDVLADLSGLIPGKPARMALPKRI